MKKIRLETGEYTIVDDEDYDELNKHKWSFHIRYAIRRFRHKDILMHRVIVNTPKGMHTDHKNGDGLDNRKVNLRICSNSCNIANSKRMKNNKSGFKGVCYHIAVDKWVARICKDKKSYWLGLFDSPQKAHKAYRKKAKELFGEFARFE